MPYTVKDAAREALAVQSAVNLPAVVNAFSRALGALREEGLGTDTIRFHPVTTLFADKLHDMAFRPEFVKYWKAYEACKELAGEEVSV